MYEYSKVKYFYLKIFYISCSIISIQCTCRINIPFDETLRPYFYKTIGSHKVKVNVYNTNSNFIVFENGEQLEASCDITFKRPYEKSKTLDLKCDSYIYVKPNHYGSFNNRGSSAISLECSPLKWNLYESIMNYKWCSNVTSYMLARPKNAHIDMDYSAAICYDIYNREFQSVYYTLAPKDYTNMYPTILDEYRVNLNIGDIKGKINAESFSENNFEDEQIQNWMNIINYKLRHIVHFKRNSLMSLHHLFEFASLPNLYQNNWKHYETALGLHVENDKQVYDILAGVSGAIKAPIIDNCSKNYSLVEVIGAADQKIPLYVWNYLMDRNNRSNELVIIGFNSPFNEFYSKDDVIFCADKCQEIPWLRKIALSTFQYHIMGIVFCCDVEDVRSSKRLEGFPEIDIKSMHQTTMEPIEATTISLYDILALNTSRNIEANNSKENNEEINEEENNNEENNYDEWKGGMLQNFY